MEQKLMDEFGKQFIETCRDLSISQSLTILNGEAKSRRLQDITKALSKMDDEQKDVLKQLAYYLVDNVLHNVLLEFEQSEMVSIKINDDDTEIENIRGIAAGELQGYVFIWAEKYSKYPLTHEPME